MLTHHAPPPTHLTMPCPAVDCLPHLPLPASPQVNKGKLWDSSQVDEGLPEVWVDLNRD